MRPGGPARARAGGPEVLDLAGVRSAVACHARVTPLLRAAELSERMGADVLLKLECLQRTGSFKVRGAAARLEALDETQRRQGVVACSSGNHGHAVSFVAARLGIPATIFVPEWVDPVKLEGITRFGAEARPDGATFDESEAQAIEFARARSRVYVSAYDDPWVIAGQGTIGSEIAEQATARPAAIVVPLSGGGLVAGVATAVRDALGKPWPRMVAVSAENAAVMLASVRAGHPVELPEVDTLANALAGGIGLDNRHSFDLVRDLVDVHVTVTEAEIGSAMRYAAERLHLVVEGGGAVALAALLSRAFSAEAVGEGPVVVVLSGGNVALKTLASVLGSPAQG